MFVLLLSSLNWLVYLSVFVYLTIRHLIRTSACSRIYFPLFFFLLLNENQVFWITNRSISKPSSNVIFLLRKEIIKWNVLDVIFRCRPSNIKHLINRRRFNIDESKPLTIWNNDDGLVTITEYLRCVSLCTAMTDLNNLHIQFDTVIYFLFALNLYHKILSRSFYCSHTSTDIWDCLADGHGMINELQENIAFDRNSIHMFERIEHAHVTQSNIFPFSCIANG